MLSALVDDNGDNGDMHCMHTWKLNNDDQEINYALCICNKRKTFTFWPVDPEKENESFPTVLIKTMGVKLDEENGKHLLFPVKYNHH